jgi:UDP-N-acetyl-D-mannosaminuronic acid dehydrogenase
VTSAPRSVSVIGLGYIGLPTAAILACSGVRVYGQDVNRATVEAVGRGEVPFAEPDLAGFVARAVTDGQLTASERVHPADAYIIAVPTPLGPDNTADLAAVRDAAHEIAPTLQPGALVILESTSPPGTTERVGEWIVERRPDLAGPAGKPRLLLAHCPERVLPGHIMTELVTNDRIVGGVTPEASAIGVALYRTFCQGELLVTDARTAELAKLVENSFRDVNIAFANELSLVCDRLGVDVWRLIELANHHPRVNILKPGPGVGGHCIAVDPYFVVQAAPDLTPLIRTARQVNHAKPAWVVDKVVAAAAGNEAPVIAALGLAFKPNVGDLRESPAIEVVSLLADRFPRAEIRAVEPHIGELPAQLAGRGQVTLTSLPQALDGADVAVLLVDHQAFSTPPALGAGTKVVDTRGQWR